MKLKSLVLYLVLIFTLVFAGMAGADCLIPAGTNLWIYNVPQDVWFPAHTQKPQRVTLLEKQPDKEYLKRFDIIPGMDWSDGVIAHDHNAEINILIKRSDIRCDNDI